MGRMPASVQNWQHKRSRCETRFLALPNEEAGPSVRSGLEVGHLIDQNPARPMLDDPSQRVSLSIALSKAFFGSLPWSAVCGEGQHLSLPAEPPRSSAGGSQTPVSD